MGTKHTEYYCSTQDTKDIIPRLAEIYDEPFTGISAIPTILISEIAKENVSVVLSGDGGDELFNGYTSYGLFNKRYRFIQDLPLRSTLKRFLNYVPDPIMNLYDYNGKYYQKYLKLKNTLEYNDISNMFKVSNSIFTKYEVEKILYDNYFFKTDDDNSKVNNLEKMMISDFKGYLSDDILVKVDRASMSVSLETREPLLDNKIIEFASKLPIEYKHDKKILRDILSKYIPKELFERKKRGFGFPMNDWLRTDLKYLIDYYLDNTRIQRQGLMNMEYIKELKILFFSKKNDTLQIWSILIFQMWYEYNFKDTN